MSIQNFLLLEAVTESRSARLLRQHAVQQVNCGTPLVLNRAHQKASDHTIASWIPHCTGKILLIQAFLFAYHCISYRKRINQNYGRVSTSTSLNSTSPLPKDRSALSLIKQQEQKATKLQIWSIHQTNIPLYIENIQQAYVIGLFNTVSSAQLHSHGATLLGEKLIQV